MYLTQPSQGPTAWIRSMKHVANAIRKCAKSEGKHVALRGGGGGGAGFETYFPWNVTGHGGMFPDTPEDITPNAVSFGYGFQFALGPALQAGDSRKRAVRLQPNAGFAEAAFVACPGSSDDSCSDCVDEPSGELDGHAISLSFACSTAWATQVCGLASYQGTTYGKYGHYSECNCPVSGWYLARYLPNTSAFEPQKKPHCYPGEGQPPSITQEKLKANCAKWCGIRAPQVGGSQQICPILPGCECLLRPPTPTVQVVADGEAVAVAGGWSELVLQHFATALLAGCLVHLYHRSSRRRLPNVSSLLDATPKS